MARLNEEKIVGSLFLSLVVVGLGLGVLLYVGSLFLQGYIYTVPGTGLAWQAPAAAGAVFLFLTFWCLIIANSSTASPTEVPYDALFRFTPKEDMVKNPVKELDALYRDKKNKEKKVTYVLHRDPRGRNHYVEKNSAKEKGTDGAARWKPEDVKEIHLTHQGQLMIFEAREAGTGANRHFVHTPSGWTLVEFDDGPTGIPWVFRWSRFFFTFFLNLFHLALWFACFWLLLRFQWGHALGLAMVMWLLFTLAFLPILLDTAGQVALDKRSPQGTKSGAGGRFKSPLSDFLLHANKT